MGAALAGKFVTVSSEHRALPSGVLIGVAVCVMSIVHSLPVANVVLALIGAAGGFFVVPLNALPQERGQNSVGTGHAIAIQNLGENATMLIMIGVYAFLVRAGVRIDLMLRCTPLRALLAPRTEADKNNRIELAGVFMICPCAWLGDAV
jgi:MFS transporter, LPLT family, lysophospholipid transporter